MSYCRFSSDNWQSDVYVYADVTGGFALHVASRKLACELTPLPDINDDEVAWAKAYQAQLQEVSHAPREDIGLPYDGESYYLPDVQATLDKLFTLRDAGYRIPQHAIERLQGELDDV